MQRPGDFPPICFVPGDTIVFEVVLTDASTETPMDLTGATAKAEVRRTGSFQTEPEATFAITAPDSSGSLTLSLEPEETHSLIRDLVWDLEITFADDRVRTVVAGELIPLRDVTQ